MIVYDGLRRLMQERGIARYALIKQHRISAGQLARLKRNESVSTHTIEIFCKILYCQVEDIMRDIPEAE